MPRYVRKTERGITDWNKLVAAIKDIKIDNKGIRSTAKTYNIPKSSLARYIQKFNDTKKKWCKKKKSSSSSPSEEDNDNEEEDVDFCIICMKNMPRKLTRYNSIKCNMCKRAVHLKCANMRTSFFTCKNCESD